MRSLGAALLGLTVAGCVTNGVPTLPSGTAQPLAASPDAPPLHACAMGAALQEESTLNFARERARALDARAQLKNGMERVVHTLANRDEQPRYREDTTLADYLPYAIFQTGYANYSADYRPLGAMLDRGDIAEAGHYLAFAAAEGLPQDGQDDTLASAIGGLGLLERGTIHFAAGDLDCARHYFDFVVRDFRAESGTQTTFSRIADAVFDSYTPEGYETVMAIDYKAMADILNRDERARNNIRLARDWQARERARYRDTLNEARREQRRALREEGVDRRDFAKLSGSLQHHLSDACASCAEIAERVSSPYVNPLPDFLSGLWAEQEAERARLAGDSVGYTAERSRARAAYANALELNPANPVVRDAVDELIEWQRARDEGKAETPEGRLVHVAFDIGRAPEHKVAVLNIPLSLTTIIPFQIAVQEPVEIPVAHVRVEAADGTPLAEVSPLADVEAMAMRHFRDELPIRLTKSALAAVAQYWVQAEIAGKLSDEEGGGFLAAVANSAARAILSNLTRPGTEAWMSLPGRVAVGRFRLDETMGQAVYLASYDHRGALLDRQPVMLDREGPTFVYGRAMGRTLRAISSAGTGPAKDPETEEVPEFEVTDAET